MKWILLLLLVVSLGVVGVQAEGIQQDTTHDTLDRSYYLVVPDTYSADTPMPLVIALHGTASTGKAMAAMTGLEAAAQEQGFIAVFPNSAALMWNEGVTQFSEADDIGFLMRLLDDLQATYAISEVLVTGHGSGGLMAYKLACEKSDRIQSVAVVSAMMWETHQANCNAIAPQNPVNVLMIRGEEDPYYLRVTRVSDVSGAGDTLQILGVDDMLEYWAARNGCAPEDETLNEQARLISCDNSQIGYYEVERGSAFWMRQGDYELNQMGVDLTDKVLNFFFANDQAWAAEPDAITSRLARHYNVYVPASYDPAEPMPLVTVLHGRPGNGTGMAFITDMHLVAESQGFIVVYPDAINNEWNYVKDVPIFPSVLHDDSQFLASIVHDVAQNLNVDQSRAYLTGFSNGGFMTQRAACDVYDTYAAFAAVGATAFWGMSEECAASPPVPLLMMHGTADISIPWNGVSRPLGGRLVYVATPMPATLEFWVMHNQCDTDFQDLEVLPQLGDSPETQVAIFSMTACADRGAFVFYSVEGGGHNWPGVPGRISEQIAGNVNLDINAGEVIWEFFSQFSLPE